MRVLTHPLQETRFSTFPSAHPGWNQSETIAPKLVDVRKECPVCSYNEWDPLEEVIVGRVEGIDLLSVIFILFFIFTDRESSVKHTQIQ